MTGDSDDPADEADDRDRGNGSALADEADDRDGWPVVDTRVEYECPWFTVGVDSVRRPDGEVADYYWVDPGDAVGVLAVTDDDRLVAVEQYRPKLDDHVRTLPAGICDPGESFVAAGTRELREETGYAAAAAELLDSFYVSSTLRQEFGVVAAAGLEAGEQRLDPGEFVDARLVPVASAREWLADGETTGWTLAALSLGREAGLL